LQIWNVDHEDIPPRGQKNPTDMGRKGWKVTKPITRVGKSKVKDNLVGK